jgi:hypothetical protein
MKPKMPKSIFADEAVNCDWENSMENIILANHHLYIFFMASNCDNEFQLATSSL